VRGIFVQEKGDLVSKAWLTSMSIVDAFEAAPLAYTETPESYRSERGCRSLRVIVGDLSCKLSEGA
jgi:hypothetical protein